MEQLAEFDRKLKKEESYQFLMCRVLQCILLPLACLAMMIPIEEDFLLMLAVSFYLLALSAKFHMQPYLYIKQQGKLCSVYQILKTTPLKRKDYLCARRKRLQSFLCLIAAAALCGQLVGNFLDAGVTTGGIVRSLLYSLFMTAIVGACELTDIVFSAKK